MSQCPRPDKTAFTSRAEAAAVLQRMTPKRRKHLNIYRCTEGGHWHHGRRYRRPVAGWRAA